MQNVIHVPNPQSGVPVDVSNVDVVVGGQTITASRQRMVIADDASVGAVVSVANTTPAASDYGLAVRPISPEESASLSGGVKWIHTSGSYVVKNSAGFIARLIINGAGDTGSFAGLWDGDPATTGQQFANVNLSSSPCTLEYKFHFNSSLTVVVTGNADFTLVYA